MFGASMRKPRERWLPQDELHMLWKALNETSVGGGSVAAGARVVASSVVMSLSVADALRLIIFTGVRRSERWDQINGDRWTIPATKNGKSHDPAPHSHRHRLNQQTVCCVVLMTAERKGVLGAGYRAILTATPVSLAGSRGWA